MIEFIRETPAWLIEHPWIVAGSAVLCLALLTVSILFNPEDRQLRERLSRHRRRH